MTNNTTKRFIMLLLTAILCSVLWALPALAEGTSASLQALIDGAASGATLTLSEDYALTAPVTFPASKTLTINGNGFTIKRATGYTGNMLSVDGIVTMENVTVDGGANWGGATSLTDATTNSGIVADDVSIKINTNGSLKLGTGSIVQNNDKRTTVSTEFGAAVTVSLNGKLVIDGGTIRWNRIMNGGSSECGGPAVYACDATVEMQAGEISHNAAYSSATQGAEGGAVFINSTGGPSATDKSTFKMSGGKVTQNWSSYQAGGIMLAGYQTYFDLEDGEISYNTAPVMGAVNANSHSHMTMTGGKICNNTATATISADAVGFSGGVVGVTSGSELLMSAGEICNNTSMSSASALDIYGVSGTPGELSTATLTGTASIHDNYCAGTESFTGAANYNRGGTVVVHGDGILNIEGDAEIVNNSVSISPSYIDRSFGGGVLMLYGGSGNSTTGATVNMSGGTISNNEAGCGGGVAMNTLGVMNTTTDKLKFNMSGGVISDNSCSYLSSYYGGGGGIYSRLGIVDISGGSIEYNTSATKNKYGGGGICMDYSATLYFSGGSVCENSSERSGGGIYLGNYSGYSYLTGGSIESNTANFNANSMSDSASGGGVWAYSKATYITDGVSITDNSAAYAGGIYVKNPVYLLGGTVADNYADKDYGNAIGVNGALFVLDGTEADVDGDIYLNTSRFVTLVEGADKDYYLTTKPTDAANGRTVVTPLASGFSFDGTNDGTSNPTSYGALASAEPYVDQFTHNIKAVTTGTLEQTYSTDSGNLVLTEYHVSFDLNVPSGATATPDPASINPIVVKPTNVITSAADFPSPDPTLAGYRFAGWYRDAALTTSLTDTDTMPKNDITLYAKWELILWYTVTYDKNDTNATSAPVDSNSPYMENSTPSVLDKGSMALENAHFIGWNTLANGMGTHYDAGDTLPALSADVTLYAQWLKTNKTSIQEYPADTLKAGEKISYSITVIIPETITGMTVTDVVPTGTTYNNDASNSGSLNNGKVTWNIGTASAGQTFTLTFSVTVDDTAQIGYTAQNSADVELNGSTYTTNTVRDTVQIVKASALDAGNAQLDCSENINYTISYYNPTASAQTNVVITDRIPAETTYVAGSISANGDDTALVNGTGTLTWTIPSVAPGATITVSFSVLTNNVVNDTLVKNTATAVAGGVTSVSNETENTLIGREPTYTATLVKVDSVSSTTYLANAVFDLFKQSAAGDVKIGTYTTDANGKITVNDLTAGNYYWVETTAPSGYMPDPSHHAFMLTNADVEVTVANVLDNTAQLVKASALDAGNVQLDGGENINYTITYDNATSYAQTNVVITDRIPAETTYVAGSISANGDDTALVNGTGTLTWTIPSVAAGTTVTVSFSVLTNNVVNDTLVKNTATATTNGATITSNETVNTLVGREPTYTATLVKVDSKSSTTYLANAEFDLFKINTSGDVKVGTYTTDASGKIIVIGLDKGYYYWVEVGAPFGYKLDSSRHPFALTTGDKEITVSNTRFDVPPTGDNTHHFLWLAVVLLTGIGFIVSFAALRKKQRNY